MPRRIPHPRPRQGLTRIPEEGELRTLYEQSRGSRDSQEGQMPGYRLLVMYLQRFPIETGIAINNLGSAERKAIQPFQYRTPPHTVPPPSRRMPQPKASTLALAWLLMERDNKRVVQPAGVLAAVKEVAQAWQRNPKDLLRWSFVPRRVAELLPVREANLADRQIDARRVRALRQRQARDLPIPPELHGLEPTSRANERQWWGALGLDKNSSKLTRQRLWTLIFTPLVNYLLGKDHSQKSYRKATRDASRLVNLRYPDLWPNAPELVRKRFIRS